jgi:broad specificity phosphatase PhoE
MPRELSPHEIKPSTTMLRRWGLSLWGSTVILVRHADIVNAGSDPGLSAAGLTRATLLAHMLQDAALSAVFVTQFLRSVETGTPAATAAGLAVTPYTATDAAGLVTSIRINHANKTVLVVAHSNTVDDIAAGLGTPSVGELAATQFDRMFVITRTWCGTRVCRMRYGASTP